MYKNKHPAYLIAFSLFYSSYMKIVECNYHNHHRHHQKIIIKKCKTRVRKIRKLVTIVKQFSCDEKK